MSVTGEFHQLKQQLLAHTLRAGLGVTDASMNTRYYNYFHFELDGTPYQIYVQRWCRGRRTGQVNFIKVRRWPGTEFCKLLTHNEVVNLFGKIKIRA